jgi:hypothetical protein
MGLIIDIIIVVLLLILTICEITFTKVLSRLEKKLTEEKPKWFDFERLKNQVEVQWKIIKDLEEKIKKVEMPKEEKVEKIEKTERRIDITI